MRKGGREGMFWNCVRVGEGVVGEECATVSGGVTLGSGFEPRLCSLGSS